MRNIAVADEYEPGSVFKIVAASRARSTTASSRRGRSSTARGKDRLQRASREACRGTIERYDHPLTVAEIIAHSSNKGAAQLAMRLGDQPILRLRARLRVRAAHGLPGRRRGRRAILKPPPRSGTADDHAHADGPVRDGDRAADAAGDGRHRDGGVLLGRRSSARCATRTANLVYRFHGRMPHRQGDHGATARTMARLLTGVAPPDGTAPEAAIPHFEVAGKTGTRRSSSPWRSSTGSTVLRYSDQHDVASFVGFFPASRPADVDPVIIDDADARCPGGVAYGAQGRRARSFKHTRRAADPVSRHQAQHRPERRPLRGRLRDGGGGRGDRIPHPESCARARVPDRALRR